MLVLTALLILPLLAFTGLAVDLGAWYGRAAQLQKAADAAALAGVVALPDVARADAAAREVATANGFTSGVDGITVTVEPVSDHRARLKVSIADAAADQFFTQVFTGGAVDIGRAATAEYVKPVPMGSPKNFLGSGDTHQGTDRENFWLAVSGGCASKEQGDLLQAQTDANFDTTTNPPRNPRWAGCTGGNTVTNTSYDPNGYFYAVEFAEDYSGTVRLQVFDGPHCEGGAADDTLRGFDTTFTVRDNSSYNPLATAVLSRTVMGPSQCGGSGGRWTTLHTLNNPSQGTYFIQVQSETFAQSGNSQEWMGSNAFGLRAFEDRNGSTFRPCTSDPSAAGHRTDCPNVYGVNHMGVLASLSGTQPSFYLADIGPEHNNKVMEVSLWDPGEGSTKLEVLDPLGRPVRFEWEVMCQSGSSGPCSGETAPAGGYGPGTGSSLDLGAVGTDYPQPGLHRTSTSKYSDRLVRLRVDLPEDITEAYGGKTWWRIRYTVGSAPTDRTTWSVAVKGDPVRLVPNR